MKPWKSAEQTKLALWFISIMLGALFKLDYKEGGKERNRQKYKVAISIHIDVRMS